MERPHLIDDWRERAVELERYGAHAQAAALRVAADDLEAWWTEPIDLERAVEETGYTRDTLRGLVRRDKIRHVDGRPRRCDLPRHVVKLPPPPPEEGRRKAIREVT